MHLRKQSLYLCLFNWSWFIIIGSGIRKLLFFEVPPETFRRIKISATSKPIYSWIEFKKNTNQLMQVA